MKLGFRAVAAGIALVVYVALAVQVWLGQRDPETSVARPRALAAWIGPPARALNEAARDLLREAVEVLNDHALSAAERLAGYRSRLERALGLYERSLHARPLQPEALAYVAALRFELDPPSTDADSRELFEMIEQAARIGAESADVQLKVGRLRISMGDRDGALAPIRRAVELEPFLVRDAVALLVANLFSIEEILITLPAKDMALVALEPVFRDEGKDLELFEALEPRLDDAEPAVLTTFANAGLRARQPARLLAALAEARFSQPASEAERRLSRARAHRDLGQLEEAKTEAAQARDLQPADARFVEFYGQTLAAAGDPERAIAAYRDALAILAQAGAEPKVRARLHREIGQAEESRHRPDRAYDAFRRAIEIDPDEPIAARRLREMGRASGLGGR